MTTNYYEHFNDFEGLNPKPEIMPSDVKRIISHCDNTYYRRFYFFSPSQKQLYRYYKQSDFAVPITSNIVYKSIRYQLIPDIDDGTPNTPNKRDNIIKSDRFMMRIIQIHKLILPKLRKI